MPWIWSDKLASLPNVSVSQKLRDVWTQRPVAVWNPGIDDLCELAVILAAEDEEPPLVLDPCAVLLAA